MTGGFEFPVAIDYLLLEKYLPTSEERKRFVAKFKEITRIYVNSTESRYFEELVLVSWRPTFCYQQLATFQSIRKLDLTEYAYNSNYFKLLNILLKAADLNLI